MSPGDLTRALLSTPLGALFEAAAEAGARRALEAIGASSGDALLDVTAVAERFGVGRKALLAAIRSGEVAASHGPRRRILVRARDVEAWLASRPYQSPEPKPVAEPEDPFDRAIASGKLRVIGGRK